LRKFEEIVEIKKVKIPIFGPAHKKRTAGKDFLKERSKVKKRL